MTGNMLENNWVMIAGTISDQITFNHEIYGERFFSGTVAVPRLSDNVDYLPFTVSERLISPNDLVPGRYVCMEGQFRSYNKRVNNTNKLILTIFTREISFPAEEVKNPNSIKLNGYVCKPPVYRTTPFNREITDMLLAVNRSYNKSDYIPVISWGRNARFAGSLKVGTHLTVNGRIQSRIYQKKLPDNRVVEKTAFEVSVTRIEVLRDVFMNEGETLGEGLDNLSTEDMYEPLMDQMDLFENGNTVSAKESDALPKDGNDAQNSEEMKGTMLSMGFN